MLSLGMVDQPHYPKRPVLHCPKSHGALSPSDVVVEAFAGPVDFQGEIREGTATQLHPQQSENGTTLYAGDIVLAAAGRTGVTLRALPSHPDLVDRFEMNIVTWAQG